MDTIPVLLAGGEGGDFNPIVLDNWSLLFWTAITFVLLIFILTKLLWKPLLAVIDQRESRISGDIEAAEAARQEAEEVRARHREEMERAAADAKKMLEEARERAEALRSELEAKARTGAEELLDKARRQIDADKAEALRDIREHVVELSVAITREVVGKDVGQGDHAAEADRLLAKVRETN